MSSAPSRIVAPLWRHYAREVAMGRSAGEEGSCHAVTSYKRELVQCMLNAYDATEPDSADVLP
jgi:hypothetical protein